MAMPDREVIRDYTVALTNIRSRLSRARSSLDPGAGVHEVESAALNIRFALEELLLSALITHKADLGAVTKSLRKADAGDARKRVERVNPDWWPNPQDLSPGGPPGIAVTAAGHHDSDFMTAEEWGRCFGTVSDLLHARNPFAPTRPGTHIMRKQLIEIVDRTWRLLRTHTLSTGVDGVLILARFDDDNIEVGLLTKDTVVPDSVG